MNNRRPNILFIITDQQRWDAFGANGNREIQTPNLDRLAAEGTNFDHFFVQNPVCMPSRVSMLTGQYPSALRITHMGVPVPDQTMTLPKLLRNYGYTSANLGKLHFLPHASRDHREIHPDYGFDELEISDEPGCYEDAYRAWVRRHAPDQLDYISVGLPPATQVHHRALGIRDGIQHPEQRFPKRPVPFPGRSDLTHSAFVAERTLDFLERNADRPFLCISGFYSPHSPWVAPQEFIDQYTDVRFRLPEFPPEIDAQRTADSYSDEELQGARQGYYAMISEVDHHVGRLLDALDELGLSENTVVVFTSDHGEWLGEHLRYGKGFHAPDCVSRVPLIIRYPELQHQSGRMVSGIVEGVDIVPTLLDCAGTPLPEQLQGTSLLPAMLGDHFDGKSCALIEGKGVKAVRTREHHYLVRSDGREQLWDLATDPMAYHDVSEEPEQAKTLAQIRATLLQRLLSIERPLPRVWPY